MELPLEAPNYMQVEYFSDPPNQGKLSRKLQKCGTGQLFYTAGRHPAINKRCAIGRYGCLLLLCIRMLRAVNAQTCPNGYNLQIYMLSNRRVHRNMILRNCAA